MKIALLTDGIYPYVMGGMQKHSFYLVKFMLRHQVQVDLYHMNQSTKDIYALECFSDEEKVNLRSFVIDFPASDPYPGHYIRASYRYSERILEEFVRNNEVDFVYAKGFTAWRLLEEKAKGRSFPPVGVNFHGYEMFQKAPGMMAWIAQWLLLRKPVLYNVKHADFLFSYGGKITTIIKTLTMEHKKILELPTGIEKQWLIPVKNEVHKPLRFVFVGRYEERKGVREITEVLEELLNGHSFQFSFIGPIPEDKKLKLPGVSYHGSVADQETIQGLLAESDVLVCPSHSEGMPNVILEAMACRMAIIASDVGAVELLVDESNGILIRPGNNEDLKVAMLQVLNMSETIIAAMKERSGKKAEHFLWDNIIEKLLDKVKKTIL